MPFTGTVVVSGEGSGPELDLESELNTNRALDSWYAVDSSHH